MSSRRVYLIIALVALVSSLGGILGNIASGVLPAAWQPYLWLAWPLFILSVAVLAGLGIWHARVEEKKGEEEPPPELDEPATPPPFVRRSTPRPAADEFAYDVFISYSSADKGWVRGELLPRLEAEGLTACIDFRDFEPGAPSATEMERAVLTSRHTLLVLTPAYLDSAWTEFEALMLQALDPANRQRRLIPLLKERCDLPPRIGYLTYVNFCDPQDLALAWRQLFTALGAPPEQEAPAAPPREGWHLKHPYLMPPNFTGRAAEREMLSGWLAADAGHPLLALRALGGFGKSALAWQWLLHDVDAARWPRAVWWGFYDDRNFEAFLRETLAYLGADPGNLNPRGQADALLYLLRRPGTLLVLDGFERALRAYGGMAAAYQGDAPSRSPHKVRFFRQLVLLRDKGTLEPPNGPSLPHLSVKTALNRLWIPHHPKNLPLRGD